MVLWSEKQGFLSFFLLFLALHLKFSLSFVVPTGVVALYKPLVFSECKPPFRL